MWVPESTQITETRFGGDGMAFGQLPIGTMVSMLVIAAITAGIVLCVYLVLRLLVNQVRGYWVVGKALWPAFDLGFGLLSVGYVIMFSGWGTMDLSSNLNSTDNSIAFAVFDVGAFCMALGICSLVVWLWRVHRAEKRSSHQAPLPKITATQKVLAAGSLLVGVASVVENLHGTPGPVYTTVAVILSASLVVFGLCFIVIARHAP